MIEPEVIVVPAVFLIPSVVILARMWFKHKEKMASLTGETWANTAIESRLARIEDAVETIAVEVERLGEGQRFVTKLLADRSAPSLSEQPKNGGSGRVTTPH
jgi:hypothetical protein